MKNLSMALLGSFIWLMAPVSHGADITGQWRGEFDSQIGLQKYLFTFHTDGEKLAGKAYDLVLPGHSHGGQVRLPFYGPVIVPFGVGRYDLGLYRTDSGPLYVNSGIGWYPIPVRFNCRPEITVIEI